MIMMILLKKACDIIISHLENIQNMCDKQEIEIKENPIIMDNSWILFYKIIVIQ